MRTVKVYLGSGKGRTVQRRSGCSALCLRWGLETEQLVTIGLLVPEADLAAAGTAGTAVAVPEAGNQQRGP